MIKFIAAFFAGLQILLSFQGVQGSRYDRNPSFMPPKYSADNPLLQAAFANITATFNSIVSRSAYDASSFSFELTSGDETIWSLYHTARVRDTNRPGAAKVKGDSVYRMASVTKTITTLAIIQLHAAGKLNIDNPVIEYIPKLKAATEFQWDQITLRAIASQLSGVPGNIAMKDVASIITNPNSWGLPVVENATVPICGEYSNYTIPCTHEDLFYALAYKEPVYAPKLRSTYSNINFYLLGIVIENVSKMEYTDYVKKHIFDPLGLTSSSFIKPSDSVAVLPNGPSLWDGVLDIEASGGGMFSSSADMSKYLRWLLKNYNNLSPQFNWFAPASFTPTMTSSFGMPWEIFRSDRILSTVTRPVTFYTKSGSGSIRLPSGVENGYFTIIMALPEYGIGISLLTAGLNTLIQELKEAMTIPLIHSFEAVAQESLANSYAGTYSEPSLNSTITLSQTAARSMYISAFISRGVDILTVWKPLIDASGPAHIQLIPTFRYRNQTTKQGEIWRGVIIYETHHPNRIWDTECTTDDDTNYYWGKPLLEVVFWKGSSTDQMVKMDLTAFEISLKRSTSTAGSEKGKYNDSPNGIGIGIDVGHDAEAPIGYNHGGQKGNGVTDQNHEQQRILIW